MSQRARTISLLIEKPVYGGYSLGRLDGKAVLVPYTAPGEEVLVRITEDKKDYSLGAVETIVSRSGSRIEPACPFHEQCGGCCYQHLSYDCELQFKKIILLDCMARMAGMDAAELPEIAIAAGDRFNYRSHATLKAGSDGQGFYRKGSNELIPLHGHGCLLLAPELNRWIDDNPEAPGGFRIAADSTGRVISSREPGPVVRDTAGGLTFMRGIQQFFQANRILRGRMMEIVKEYAGIDRAGSFIDIGCGVGFFTLALAGISGSGFGIDINSESIRWARQNAIDNSIENVRFQAMPSARIHPGRMRPGLVVIDPPRAGIDRKTRSTILAMDPDAIVYVSCNPSTFARDAKDFIMGGYRLDRMSLIDMFPCTHHIEVISRFARRQVRQGAGERTS